MKLVQKQLYLFSNILLKNALFKDDFKDFNIPQNIFLTSLNYDTGLKSTLNDKNNY